MSATNFKTENNTYRKLIGNGLVYRIPPFQRDYSWDEEEWEDLWADLLEAMKPGGAHYLGYLVLQSNDDRTFDVIDGQQRLTTLSLLVLAVLKHLQRLVERQVSPEENGQRAHQIRQTYLGYLDPVTLVPRSKLTLNRNNDAYYQRYLVPLERLPSRRLRASERLLRKGFEWFDRKVGDQLVPDPAVDVGPALARFLEDTSDRLFFTVINVTDELNAFKVFETLNARGVRLSSTDLLKNLLFSVLNRPGVTADEVVELEERWESLVGKLGSERFPDFLRVHWLSRGKFVRQAELFKAVKQEVTGRGPAFDLLRRLEEDLEHYLTLTDPEDSSLAPGAKESVRVLRLFGVKQPIPMLVAASRTFPPAELEALLRAAVVLCFRYNVVGGRSPGEQEPVFADIAKQIVEGRTRGASEAIRDLAGLYPRDESFVEAFVDKTFSRGKEKLIRYVLCELERQHGNTGIDRDSDRLSIEHILPQAAGPEWAQFSVDEVEAMTWRLGNLVLLRKGPNAGIGNRGWGEKRVVLEQSEFALTRQVALENAEWTPERLMGRQRKLANMASGLWRLSQLSAPSP